jgi:hypothetical protein
MEQLFNAIPNVLNDLGPNAATDEAFVFAAWARCAGVLLRTRTAPLEFFENRLVIAVEDEIWRRHLEDLSPQMLAKINGFLGRGTVRFMEFRINASALSARREPNNVVAKKPNVGDLDPSLAIAAKAIADENLREMFLSAASSYLADYK